MHQDLCLHISFSPYYTAARQRSVAHLTEGDVEGSERPVTWPSIPLWSVKLGFIPRFIRMYSSCSSPSDLLGYRPLQGSVWGGEGNGNLIVSHWPTMC